MKERGNAGDGLLSYAPVWARRRPARLRAAPGPAGYLRPTPVEFDDRPGRPPGHGGDPAERVDASRDHLRRRRTSASTSTASSSGPRPAPGASTSPTARCASAATTSPASSTAAHRRSARLQPRTLGGGHRRGHGDGRRALAHVRRSRPTVPGPALSHRRLQTVVVAAGFPALRRGIFRVRRLLPKLR